ncbi:SPOR domain-containing protein [Sphingomonas sp.]|uniref:SPOR domain-containing protein n=1 Tax=Sphingomonas sp. TaxID=28214 RepID=UPI0025ECA313|nr:SPOR domain-containing protein [Sphingomonas sp.]
MKTTAIIKLAASTLMIGATMVGCSPSTRTSHLASASDTKSGKMASKAAYAATKALTARDFQAAVGYAEAAVLALPRDAGYRMLLGQAYLGAGRFASAETAFSETLMLMPDHERAALNLALVQIALGKNHAALTTLGDYRDKIGASDYGLALALAGDTDGGVRALESAVRGPRADAKSRQNLALAYALSGEWNKAHVTAAQDLAPADADARIIQWASFAKPGNETDRVATLLGVQPVVDGGQPARLALAPVADAAAQVALAPAVPVAVATAPVVVAVAAPVVAPVVALAPPVFETATVPAKVVVEAPVIFADATPVKQEIVTVRSTDNAAKARPTQGGKFVVQLGAFANAAISRDAWHRSASRYGLADYIPANSQARIGGARYVRLSVGGFETRAEATHICVRIKAAGGDCFVRDSFADKPASWVQSGMPKSMRVAAR